jgi:hypothetical protein
LHTAGQATLLSALLLEEKMEHRGPRTAVGKLRSKFNAIKYGIFASVVLLPSESQLEFDSLWEGLKEYYQPNGAVEHLKVEQLATQFWRYRRFLIAERAEIQKQIAFPRENNQGQRIRRVTIVEVVDGEEDYNLMGRSAFRDECLCLLKNLKSGIASSGFDISRDSAILEKLYGKSYSNNDRKGLFARYPISLSTASNSAQEPRIDGSTSPEPCERIFLEEVEKEIRRLEHRKLIESESEKLEALRLYVPASSLPEHLLRYGAHLERSMHRTMAELDHLQKWRLGLPVPPSI